MEKREQVIEGRLQRLIKRMRELGYNEYMIGRVAKRVNELQQRGVYCVDRFVQKLLDRVNEKEAYLDILMEGRFAVILARNKFTQIHIEYSDEGPDIKANYHMSIVYFEITRERPGEEDIEIQSTVAFVSAKRMENIISKIQGKIPQLRNGEVNIVVIWSDTVRLSLPEIEEAFKYIQQEIDQNPGTYKDLSGVLFTESGGVDVATMKQFYLFKNNKASKPVGTRLGRKLESLHERDLNELQKELEDLTAAVKQLKAKRNL